ncbi:hypothetical protein [Metabacillus bambusae]|uniref:Uncharacterized protein n=1 Tax=Metabacillus bambusae TaxID=2795218 RepID=A0ABS3N999_9BACI|nr:hypothetical protein [Metabacillus bambusae]MBO1514753.1 hypothetical protein [Metabacillus bambusae]
MEQFIFGFIGYTIVLILLFLLPINATAKNKSIIATLSLFISYVGIIASQTMNTISSWVIVFLLSIVGGYLIFNKLNFFSNSVNVSPFVEGNLENSNTQQLTKDFFKIEPNIQNKRMKIEDTKTQERPEEEIDFLSKRLSNNAFEDRIKGHAFHKNSSTNPSEEIEIDFEKILSQEPFGKGEQ